MPKETKSSKAKTKKKKTPKKTTKKKGKEKKKNSDSGYLEAVGRRKTAVARVRLWTKGKKEIVVNDKDYQDYFALPALQDIVSSPLEVMRSGDKFKISAQVKGGGLHGQAEAVRHGLSRVLVEFNPDFRKRLKKSGFLTRDPRMRERKKFGLRRARRAPQWSKR